MKRYQVISGLAVRFQWIGVITRKCVTNKTFICLIFLSTLMVLHLNNNYVSTEFLKYSNLSQDDFAYHEYVVRKYYEKRQSWLTSNLGTILFKNGNASEYKKDCVKNKSFAILVWKHYDWLKARHVTGYKSTRCDPLSECSVKNCVFIGDNKQIDKVDVVLVHIQKGELPQRKQVNMKQLWVFLSDESPINSFSMSKKIKNYKSFANIFNWSMTYRSDSDVPVPYGRTVPLPAPKIDLSKNNISAITKLIPDWDKKQRNVLAGILISHCKVSHRTVLIKKLKKYMLVDVHGRCAIKKKNKITCPGHYRQDCKEMSKYLFYLSLENSLCRQYLTEKCFHNAYSKGAIPVIMGPPLEDCVKLLPPDSFLHVDNYKSIFKLAEDMLRISKNETRLLGYHKWRNDFEVRNEHGFFGTNSVSYCRLCEALNYNSFKPKIYDEDEIRLFFDRKLLCKAGSVGH